VTLNWTGPAVTKKLEAAQIVGVNQTMAASAAHAKRNHDWQNRTGTLEGSIDVAEYARREGAGVRGVWGSRDVRYARIHEEGGTIEPVKAKALVFNIEGETIIAKRVEIPARPYLRPAADEEYPKLAQRIRKAYEAAPA